MKIKEYVKAKSIEEAYELIGQGAVIIGGGAFLNLGDGDLDMALDISDLGLDYITENEEELEIGAMVTIRAIEANEIAKLCFGGVLSKTAASIMGVQLRNVATLGGSVYGRYGFSDILTTLLALNAEVELYKAGRMTLEEYLDIKLERDIVLKVIIKKNIAKAAFASVRKTATDFSLLNTAAAVADGKLRVCVGARPGRARLLKESVSYLESSGLSQETAARAGELAVEELSFGSDIRASGEYRRELCKALVKRCLMEVLS